MTPEQIVERIQSDCDLLAKALIDTGNRDLAAEVVKAACTLDCVAHCVCVEHCCEGSETGLARRRKRRNYEGD